MREGFQRWLETRPIKTSTQRTILSDAKRVENAYGDLDASYLTDRFESILLTLEYTPQDELRGRPNPSRLQTKPGAKLSKLFPAYRQALRAYSAFRQSDASSALEVVRENGAVTAKKAEVGTTVSDLEAAIAKVEGEHAEALRWFEQHASQTVSWDEIRGPRRSGSTSRHPGERHLQTALHRFCLKRAANPRQPICRQGSRSTG